MSPSSERGRGRLVAALVLVAVFVVGLLAGAWGSRAFARGAHWRWRGGPPPAPWASDRERHFMRELGLSPAQQQQVDSILTRRRAQIDGFWNGEGRRLRAIVDSTRAEVRAVLTPEQRERYDRARSRMRGRAGMERPRRGPREEQQQPPPPPPAP